MQSHDNEGTKNEVNMQNDIANKVYVSVYPRIYSYVYRVRADNSLTCSSCTTICIFVERCVAKCLPWTAINIETVFERQTRCNRSSTLTCKFLCIFLLFFALFFGAYALQNFVRQSTPTHNTVSHAECQASKQRTIRRYSVGTFYLLASECSLN